MIKKTLITNVSLLAVSVALASSVFAQDADQPGAIEELVVTGTNTLRTEFETPQSVTQFAEDDLRKFTSSSQADILTQIPGIKAEGGGGEVATNAFVRSLPSGGQFAFTPLTYDGIPSFSTFGLNSSAFDVYYRNDLGIERLEYVTGGVSNLFGPGSVAGIINYISKTGGDEDEGTLQLEVAEEGRFRGDYYFSGALSDDTYYALSGFYRYDEGPLDSGLTTEGYQVRGNLRKEFSDGSGAVTVYTQVIDDQVQFFLPLPLDGESRERAVGNDGAEVFTLNTAEAQGLQYATPDGIFRTPIADGVVTEGASFAVVLDKELGDDWSLNSKIKYASYDHQFNLFLDGDGVVNVPETQADFLAARGLAAFAADASFTYTQSGQELQDDFLLFGNRTLDRVRDATDFSGEFSLARSFSRGNAEHALTLGLFFSQSEALDINYITTYLGDFRNAPHLVDLRINNAAQDADGNLVASPDSVYQHTLNGLLNANGLTNDAERSARRSAFYIADQIDADKWTFDIGLRVERLTGDLASANRAAVATGNDPLVNDDLENVSFSTGSIVTGTVGTTEWALSLGGLYRLNDNINLTANVSRGYFFPEIRSVRFNALGEPGPYEGETVNQLEAGFKFQYDNWDGYATLFYTELSDRQNVSFVNDGQGGVINQVNQTSTEALGIEAGATYQINDFWTINGNITLRDHEFTEFAGNEDFIGNELRRQPTELLNTGVTYSDGSFDVSLFHNFNGDNFANDSNAVALDSYNLFRLEAGYTLQFSGDQTMRASISLFNLTDEDGVTEGSPRLGNTQSGAANEFFVGRPILPRRVTARLTYDF